MALVHNLRASFFLIFLIFANQAWANGLFFDQTTLVSKDGVFIDIASGLEKGRIAGASYSNGDFSNIFPLNSNKEFVHIRYVSYQTSGPSKYSIDTYSSADFTKPIRSVPVTLQSFLRNRMYVNKQLGQALFNTNIKGDENSDALMAFNIMDGSTLYTIKHDLFFNPEVSIDGKYVFTVSQTELNVWDATNGSLLYSVPLEFKLWHCTGAGCNDHIYPSPNGRYVLVSDSEQNLFIWDLENRKKIFTGTFSDNFTFYGTEHLVLFNEQKIEVVNLNSGVVVNSFPAERWWCEGALIAAPTQNEIICFSKGTGNVFMKVFEFPGGKLLSEKYLYVGGSDSVDMRVVTNDGKFLIFNDGVWDLAKLQSKYFVQSTLSSQLKVAATLRSQVGMAYDKYLINPFIFNESGMQAKKMIRANGIINNAFLNSNGSKIFVNTSNEDVSSTRVTVFNMENSTSDDTLTTKLNEAQIKPFCASDEQFLGEQQRVLKLFKNDLTPNYIFDDLKGRMFDCKMDGNWLWMLTDAPHALFTLSLVNMNTLGRTAFVVDQMTFNPVAALVEFCTENKESVVWDLRNDRELLRLPAIDPKYCRGSKFSSDGKLFATTSYDENNLDKVHVYDLQTGKVIFDYQASKDAPNIRVIKLSKNEIVLADVANHYPFESYYLSIFHTKGNSWERTEHKSLGGASIENIKYFVFYPFLNSQPAWSDWFWPANSDRIFAMGGPVTDDTGTGQRYFSDKNAFGWSSWENGYPVFHTVFPMKNF